jgi:hypothetical protein
VRQVRLRTSTVFDFLLLALPVITGLLMRSIGQSPNNPSSLFLLTISGLLIGSLVAVREIVDERMVYQREALAGVSPVAYLTSKLGYVCCLSLLQAAILLPFLYLPFADSQPVLKHHAVAVWPLLAGTIFQGGLLGLCVSAIATRPSIALYSIVTLLIPQILLSGFIVPPRAPQAFTPDYPARTVNLVEPPPKAMPPFLRDVLSPLVVARWSLEVLADTFLHDYEYFREANEKLWPTYINDIQNRIVISLNPADRKTAWWMYKHLVRHDSAWSPQSPWATSKYSIVLIFHAGILCFIVFLAIGIGRHRRVARMGMAAVYLLALGGGCWAAWSSLGKSQRRDNRVRPLLAEAASLRESRSYPQALAKLSEALDLAPQNEDANAEYSRIEAAILGEAVPELFVRGQEALDRRDYLLAQQIYGRILLGDPRNKRAKEGLSQARQAPIDEERIH